MVKTFSSSSNECNDRREPKTEPRLGFDRTLGRILGVAPSVTGLSMGLYSTGLDVKQGGEASSGVLDLGWKMRRLLLFLLSAMVSRPLAQADGRYPSPDQHSKSIAGLILRRKTRTGSRSAR